MNPLPNTRTSTLGKVLRGVLVVAALVVVASLLEPSMVADRFSDLGIPLGLGLTVALTASATITAALWISILGTLDPGLAASPRGLMRAFTRTWLLRYLPGTAWSQAGRLFYAEGTVPRTLISLSLIYEYVLSVAAAGMLAGSFWVWVTLGPVWGVLSIPAILLVVTLLTQRFRLVLRPLMLLGGAILPRSWTRFRGALRQHAERSLPLRDVARIATGYLAVNGLFTGAFVALVLGARSGSSASVPMIAAAFNTAVLLGLLAPFVPAGLGVREAFLTAFLAPVITAPVAAWGALTLRLLNIGADVLLFGLVEAFGLATRGQPRHGRSSRPAGVSRQGEPNRRRPAAGEPFDPSP